MEILLKWIIVGIAVLAGLMTIRVHAQKVSRTYFLRALCAVATVMAIGLSLDYKIWEWFGLSQPGEPGLLTKFFLTHSVLSVLACIATGFVLVGMAIWFYSYVGPKDVTTKTPLQRNRRVNYPTAQQESVQHLGAVKEHLVKRPLTIEEQFFVGDWLCLINKGQTETFTITLDPEFNAHRSISTGPGLTTHVSSKWEVIGGRAVVDWHDAYGWRDELRRTGNGDEVEKWVFQGNSPTPKDMSLATRLPQGIIQQRERAHALIARHTPPEPTRPTMPWDTNEPWEKKGTLGQIIEDAKSYNPKRDREKHLCDQYAEWPDIDRYGRNALGISEWTDGAWDRLITLLISLAKERRYFPADDFSNDRIRVYFLSRSVVVDLLCQYAKTMPTKIAKGKRPVTETEKTANDLVMLLSGLGGIIKSDQENAVRLLEELRTKAPEFFRNEEAIAVLREFTNAAGLVLQSKLDPESREQCQRAIQTMQNRHQRIFRELDKAWAAENP